MKPNIPLALAGALTIVAAPGAVTDPVGYTTATISGAFGPGSPKNNVIAPDLENEAGFTGEIASIAGDVLTLTGAAFTAAEFGPIAFNFGPSYQYFVETSDGYWSHIVSNGTGDVTVEAGFGANFTAGETVQVRKHVSISDYFGAANETGLLADSTTYSPGNADNITLIDEINGGTVTVFSNDALGGTWTTTDFEEAGSLSIYPNQAIQVLRRGDADLSVVHAGSVDLNGRQLTITTGAQVRPFAYPVSVSLDDLNLYTGDVTTGVAGTATGTLSEADIVSVIVDGQVNQYVYVEADFGLGIGWYTTDFTARAPDLPAGSGIIVNRTNSVNNSPFVWVIPQITVAP